ncbi:hypothetical protein EDD18DRAFT_1108919 [Armillaria luteobubalina]|uniref:Uncharacterized protein n=1 Tax=Armillaria luteobubalina TaxID=153913 RepID=A0AA39UQ49_9AGAR|nr:hypothetical protein EDD18DRAFT_1108919 [Armillaria luteobubalina]
MSILLIIAVHNAPLGGKGLRMRDTQTLLCKNKYLTGEDGDGLVFEHYGVPYGNRCLDGFPGYYDDPSRIIIDWRGNGAQGRCSSQRRVLFPQYHFAPMGRQSSYDWGTSHGHPAPARPCRVSEGSVKWRGSGGGSGYSMQRRSLPDFDPDRPPTLLPPGIQPPSPPTPTTSTPPSSPKRLRLANLCVKKLLSPFVNRKVQHN